MFIRIGGVPGVGKTSVISLLSKAAEELRLPVSKVKGGDYLLRIAGVDNYDQLRQIPEADRAAMRPEMYRLMYADDKADPRVLRFRDAHFALKDDGHFVTCPAMPEDREQMLSMILLTANPEVICQRRWQDCDRQDRSREISGIIQELEQEERVARQQTEEIGIPLHIMDNSGHIIDTCLSIIGVIPAEFGRSSLEGYFHNLGKENQRHSG